VLGTDGFGRSDTRSALRRFFEVDRWHVVLAALQAAAPQQVAAAAQRYGLAADGPPPWTV
jgi:pyruvate dehydrogenase E1 component